MGQEVSTPQRSGGQPPDDAGGAVSSNGQYPDDAPSTAGTRAGGHIRQSSLKGISTMIQRGISAATSSSSPQPHPQYGESAAAMDNGHHHHAALHQQYQQGVSQRSSPYPHTQQQQHQYMDDQRNYHQSQQYQQQPFQQEQQYYHPEQRYPPSNQPLPRQPGHSTPRPPLPPQGHPLVDVMYASEVGSSSSVGSRGGGSGRSGGASSSSSAVASVSGRMDNLALSSSQRGEVSGKLKTAGTDEDDWKHAWDEDDESSGGEDGADDDDDDALVGPAVSSIHQPFRPGMDGAHSSSSPVKRPVGGDHIAATGIAPIAAAQHQQYAASQVNYIPSASAPAHAAFAVAPGAEEDVLTKQADKVLEEGVQWDTSPDAGALSDVKEKPRIEMFFPLLRVLGKGSFGKVVLVQKRKGKERGGLFAMKILRKAHLVKRRQIERTKTERKVLSVVDHPFIMKLHFAFQTDDKLFLVLDYCAGGELFFHLSRYRRFPERVARFYAAELLLALGHLHKRGIIYRDLKPENVLLDADGHVKLGDFGLAKDRIKHPYMGASSMCGTPEYMAPEVLTQAGHGFCVDYWGLGMLVYEMMTGLPPWYTTDRTKLFKRLKSAPLEIPSFFSHQSASCVSALLERNPKNRLGVLGLRSAVQHEFFRAIDFRALLLRRIEAPIRPCEGWKAPETSSRSNSGVSSGSHPGDGRATVERNSKEQNLDADNRDLLQMEKISSDALEAATANFDNTFTRMPVETEDNTHDAHGSGDEGGSEELNENTFIGFTFDETDHSRTKNISSPDGRTGNAPSSSRQHHNRN